MSEFASSADASAPLCIGSGYVPPHAGQVPVKHVLIAPSPAVRISIHRMHVLGYADATDWSSLLVLPQQQICFTPNPGDVMATMIRYLKLE